LVVGLGWGCCLLLAKLRWGILYSFVASLEVV
jgi:hypothetical protein